MTALFGPQGSNAVLVKPDTKKQRYGGNQSWVKDCSAPGASDGTVLDAAFYNRIIGALDYLAGITNVSALPGDDSVLYRAIMQIIAGTAPDALNTLKELADALGDDPNYSATVLRLLGKRVQFDQPQTLSSSEKLQAATNMGLQQVAWTGSYPDLSNRPVLGSAAALDAGVGANKLVQLDSAGRYPALDGSQITGIVGSGELAWSTVQSLTADQRAVAQANMGGFSFTGRLVESHVGGAATFAVKTPSGADPSAATPVVFRFPNGTGSYDYVAVTAALSITVPSGAHLGQSANGSAFRVWIGAFNDAGTVRLAVRTCASTGAAFSVVSPSENRSASSTLTPSTSAHVFYTAGAAVTSKYWAWVAFATYESGLAAAGVWSVAPDVVALVGQSTPRPGERVASASTLSSGNVSTTGATYIDSTMSIPLTPQSAANAARFRWSSTAYLGAAGQGAIASVHCDASPTIYGGTIRAINAPANGIIPLSSGGVRAPLNTTSQTTFKVQVKADAAGQVVQFPYGGDVGDLEVEEIMT